MKQAVQFIACMAAITLFTACNTEDPMPVAADFSTNLQDNTVEASTGFTVYLDNVTGEFLAYFKGDTEETSWPDGYGTPFTTDSDTGSPNQEPDSLLISGYPEAGTYTFTIVATSYGNWGETVEQDVQSIDINVVAPD